MRRKEEIKAKIGEQGAKSEGQREIAVDFSQRTVENSSEHGLQPNKMWLKPIVKIITCVRQLKQTAKSEDQKAKNGVRRAKRREPEPRIRNEVTNIKNPVTSYQKQLNQKLLTATDFNKKDYLKNN